MLAGIDGVLFDIDGTITTDGRMTAAAYSALEQVQRAGLMVIAVTGRPAGWCDLIARFWPVSAVVGENGALAFRYDHERRQMVRLYARSDAQRREDQERLRAIGADVLRAVPGARIAADQPYRETDLAIDWCEDIDALPMADVQRIAGLLRRHGLTVKVSSIHVNAWFGEHDKLTMTRLLLREQFGIALDTERERLAYIGDSPNDEPMFAFFPNSFAVANIATFLDQLTHRPAYLTRGTEGHGFAEFVQRLLAARRT